MRAVYSALVWVEVAIVVTATAVAAFVLAGWCLGTVAASDMREASARLLEAVRLRDRTKVAHMLSARPELVNVPNCVGWTPLHEAASNDDPAMVALLVEKGADVLARDVIGVEPLHAAARAGAANTARTLLARGADPSASDDSGRTPLLCARQTGRWEVVRTLRQCGVPCR